MPFETQTVKNPTGELLRSYTYAELASLLGVTQQTLMKWIRRGQMPGPVYLGASARFPAHQVAELQARGLDQVGTHEPTRSVRSTVGALGAAARYARPKARKKPKPKPSPAKPSPAKPSARSKTSARSKK